MMAANKVPGNLAAARNTEALAKNAREQPTTPTS
jgi:ribose 5-phosphate isomerase RpiB